MMHKNIEKCHALVFVTFLTIYICGGKISCANSQHPEVSALIYPGYNDDFDRFVPGHICQGVTHFNDHFFGKRIDF